MQRTDPPRKTKPTLAPFVTSTPEGTLVPGGQIYRPPSEHDSWLLQATVGCSHNRCAYCAMYRDKRFAIRPQADILALIERRAQQAPAPSRRVFLCDGDALIMPHARMVELLQAIAEHLPWVERVSTYGDSRSILRKSPAQLAELRALGLGMIYHGVETGDDACLAAISKGSTRAEIIEAADRLREAKILHSVIVLLGIGGVERSAAHAEQTASLLSQIDPPFVGALTTTVVPGTPLAEMQASGSFVLPSKFGMLRELRAIIAGAEMTNCRLSSNHASNYLPLRGTLSRDRATLLALLDPVLERGDEGVLRPEWMRGL